MSSLCKPVYVVNALPKLNPSVLKQRCVISESSEPQWVPVEFPLSSPDPTTVWDCVRNSPQKVQQVGQQPIFCQWNPMLLPFLDTSADTRGKMRYNRVLLHKWSISPFIPDPALDLEGRLI